MTFSLKSLALATSLLVATAGGSFAATIDGNTPVKAGPHKWEDTVQWAFDGQDVKILKCKGAYCYVKISGPDGWVRKADIDFGYGPGPFPPSGPYGCIYGPYGYVCI